MTRHTDTGLQRHHGALLLSTIQLCHSQFVGKSYPQGCRTALGGPTFSCTNIQKRGVAFFSPAPVFTRKENLSSNSLTSTPGWLCPNLNAKIESHVHFWTNHCRGNWIPTQILRTTFLLLGRDSPRSQGPSIPEHNWGQLARKREGKHWGLA